MATFLYCWELGGGMGHINRCASVARALVAEGHTVYASLASIDRAEAAVAELGVRFVPGPTIHAPQRQSQAPYLSYPHVLEGVGMCRTDAVRSAVSAYGTLFDMIRPDALLLDHAPLAAVALRGTGVPTARIGTGFIVPPRGRPMPPFLITTRKVKEDELWTIETRVCAAINTVLEERGQTTIECVADLFDPMATGLMTYEELDHYPNREQGRYLGVPPPPPGQRFEWKSAKTGLKVYAYLKPTKSRPALLSMMKSSPIASVAYCPGLTEEERAHFDGGGLTLLDEPGDVTLAAMTCHAAITHAGHATACDFLTHGKPLLLLPTQWEQRILSYVLEKRGMALTAATGEPKDIAAKLEKLLKEPSFRQRAAAFAQKHPPPTKQGFAAALAPLVHDLL